MPQNPINRLFGGRPRDRAPLRADVTQALAQLAQLAEERPELAELAAAQAALLQTAFAPDALQTLPGPALEISPEHAATKLAAGVPLLRGETLALDAAWLQARCTALCDALLRLTAPGNTPSPALRQSAGALKAALRSGTFDVYALAIEVLAGDPGAIVDRAAQLGLEAGFAATLVRWTLLPVLEQVAQQTAPLRQSAAWTHGYCPTCGAWPLLAEQRGIEQARILRCGLCAGEWPIGRVQCPFCESRTPADLQYLYDEAAEASQRAVTCERCHHYYKATATLGALPTAALHVTDLATVHLDLIALERAYMPPS